MFKLMFHRVLSRLSMPAGFAIPGLPLVVCATSLAVVTLKTSSTVVMPQPDEAPAVFGQRFHALRRAASRIWSVEAFFKTSCRISLSVSIHSKMACRPKNPVLRHSRQPVER